jgi:hypothetical protein
MQEIDPKVRRKWAARMFISGMVMWPLTHVGLVVLPPWFFEHVMVALSVGAILVSEIDIVETSDVRAEQ